jgi:predicted nucleic acid-binding protein
MTTVVDSNVLVAIWDRSREVSSAARAALDAAFERGTLVAPAPVFAELMTGRGRTETFLDAFFQDTAISVIWDLEERIWRAAGRAFSQYAARRRRHGETGPRRVLADFLIGAYADENRFPLLTLDYGIYRTGFPELKIYRV